MNKKCGCGKTKNADGFCDGSHNDAQSESKNKPLIKEIPYGQITIRVISTKEPQRTKHVFPNIANNTKLMRHMGFVISDPQYDTKMEAVKNKKSFSENGKPKNPAQESFTPKEEPIKKEIPVNQPKNEIIVPPMTGEPVKRKRRTRAEIEADKLKAPKKEKV